MFNLVVMPQELAAELMALQKLGQQRVEDIFRDSVHNAVLGMLPQMLEMIEAGGFQNTLAEQMGENKKIFEQMLKDKSKKNLAILVPDFAALEKIIAQINNAIQKECNIETLNARKYPPVKQLWILQLRTLFGGIGTHCEISKLITNVMKVGFPHADYQPPPRPSKPGFFTRMLYFIFPPLRERAERAYQKKLSDYKRNYLETTEKSWFGAGFVSNMTAVAAHVVNDQIVAMAHPQMNSLRASLEAEKKREAAKISFVNTPEAPKGSKLVAASKAAFGIGADLVTYGLTVGRNLILSDNEIDNVPDQDLNQHVKQIFDQKLRAETFDLLTDFARQIYALTEQSARFDSSHAQHFPPGFSSSLDAFGFSRMQRDPDFKIFVVSMLKNLGFTVKNDDQVQNVLAKLYYMPEKEFTQIRDKFIHPTEEDLDNLARAKNCVFKEIEQLEKNPQQSADSDNYLGLLRLQANALSEIEFNQRLANVGEVLPNVDDLINYHSAQTGVVSGAKKMARDVVKYALPVVVDQVVGSVGAFRLEAQNIVNNFAIGIRERSQAWLEEGYPLPADPQPKITTVAEREQAWIVASTSVNSMPREARPVQFDTIDKLILDGFKKVWLENLDDLINLLYQGNALYQADNSLVSRIQLSLRAEIERMHKSQARPELIKAKEQQLFDLGKLFQEPRDTSFYNDFERMKGVYDAITAFLNNAISNHADYDQLPLDEKQLIMMLRNSFNSLGSPAVLPTELAKVYSALFINDRETLENADLGTITTWVTEKIGAKIADYLNKNIEGPRKLLQYYIQEHGKELKPLEKAQAQPIADAGLFNKMLSGIKRAVGVAQTVGTAAVTVGLKVAEKSTQITYDTVNLWLQKEADSGATSDTINSRILKAGKSALRGQIFDAFFKMVMDFHALQAMQQRFKESHPNQADPFVSMGLGRLQSVGFLEFLNEMAESLGFEETEKYSASEVLYYSLSDPENGPKEVAALREKFIQPPETAQEIATDPFVRLQKAVNAENAAVLKLIDQNRLADSSNYVAMVSAMQTLVDNVYLVQQGHVATELYMPDLDNLLGIDPNPKGIVSAFKTVLSKNVADCIGEGVKLGQGYVVQENVNQATMLASNLLQAASDTMTLQLQEGLEHEKAPKRVPVLSHRFKVSKGQDQQGSSPSETPQNTQKPKNK